MPPQKLCDDPDQAVPSQGLDTILILQKAGRGLQPASEALEAFTYAASVMHTQVLQAAPAVRMQPTHPPGICMTPLMTQLRGLNSRKAHHLLPQQTLPLVLSMILVPSHLPSN